MGKLDGKITIVTGATSGIGRRTVEIFAREGAKVVATGRREALGRTLEASIGKDKCLFVKADATKEAAANAVDKTKEVTADAVDATGKAVENAGEKMQDAAKD